MMLCRCPHEQCGELFMNHTTEGETTCCPSCGKQQSSQPFKRETMSDYEDFLAFCKNATTQQLENILQKEWTASLRDKNRITDYNAARAEAMRRGWEVKKGQRLS